MAWLLFGITVAMFALLAGGMPVAFALGVAGATGLYLFGGMPMVIGILDTTPLSSVASYELITVPMFLLMAEFVILSGVANDLFKAAATWVGRVPGGLGVATAIAGAGFGAISGSSTAAAATLSATTIPAMMKQGYEPKMACGVVAISGTLAMLIPPSIALVLYGIIADVSIGKLLIGGVIPGLLVTLTIALTVVVLVFMDPSRAPAGRRFTWREKFESLKVTGPMLGLFLAVTGSIYLGIATPTEASGLGAFGALLLAWRAGKITWPTLRGALVDAATTSCMIFMIILRASVGFSPKCCESLSLTIPSTIPLTSELPSFVLVCPSNCGSLTFTEITAARPSLMSSPVRLASFSLSSFLSLAYLFTTDVNALRKPSSWVPPSWVLIVLAKVCTDSEYPPFHCMAISTSWPVPLPSKSMMLC